MEKSLYPARPVLLVDDEKVWLRSLSLALERLGGINHLLQCSDSREAPELVRRHRPSLILLDLTMPHLSGEDLLEMLGKEHPEIPVIVLSGLNQLETAVRSMKLGAFDYFVKSVEEERLMAGVRHALRLFELESENRELASGLLGRELHHPEAFAELVTRDPKMLALFRYVEAIAGGSQPVLITGESGVGKELMARAVHRIGRPKKPWVAVNIAGLDDNVFSDTLFGHTRGAFTGADRIRPGMVERAEGGTLFLDEIGDLCHASQVKLLRLLQEGEYFPIGSDRPKRANIRVVVATNQDLAVRQAAGEFRNDLYFRLCTHQVHIPPLRERTEDIPVLLQAFLAEAAQSFGKGPPTPPPELCQLLGAYHFPGNVREMRAMVFDAVGTHGSGKLSMESFKKAIDRQSGPDRDEAGPVAGGAKVSFSCQLPTLEEVQHALVAEAMGRAGGNQTLAARMLGISRPALSKRLKKNPL